MVLRKVKKWGICRMVVIIMSSVMIVSDMGIVCSVQAASVINTPYEREDLAEHNDFSQEIVRSR